MSAGARYGGAVTDDARPTTAIDQAQLLGLVVSAKYNIAPPEPRMTEGIAPIVMIVDRPAKVVDDLVVNPKRRSEVVDISRLRPSPELEAVPVPVVANGTGPVAPLRARSVGGGVAIEERSGPDIYVIVMSLMIVALVGWMALTLL